MRYNEKPLIEPGSKFNKLTCIKYIHRGSDNRRIYLWKCDCGNKKEIQERNVLFGRTKSCGCLHKELAFSNRLPLEDVGTNVVINQYIKSATERGLTYNLTFEEIKSLITKECDYCGRLEINCTKIKGRGLFKYNGIDRVNNKRGYEIDNCVTCCNDCNRGKGTKTREEFLKWIEELYNHSIGVII